VSSEHKYKIDIAKNQITTALYLFINDFDSISVHNLACSSCEILDGISEANNIASPSTWVRMDFDLRTIKRARGIHWNTFKHFYDTRGKTIRDDRSIASSFSDDHNDPMLFQGILDISAMGVTVPVEAQVYTFWYISNYPSYFSVDMRETASSLFPFDQSMPRSSRKSHLLEECKNFRSNTTVMNDRRTDPREIPFKA